MSINTGNIDVITATDGLKIPHCAHGPALLFTRFDQASSSERKFFACSAFRDRKSCPFFQWCDVVKADNSSEDRRCARIPELWPSLDHKEMRRRFKLFKKLNPAEWKMCQDCGLLLLPGEETKHERKAHKITTSITNEMLKKPTEMFTPLDDNKTFAQYLFSQKTTEFVLQALSNMNVTHMLCIGCPRIHEAVQSLKHSQTDTNMESLLLDLDHRFLQVFEPGIFCRYNMLNHHFFSGDTDIEVFMKFIAESSDKRVAMVIDPPFGIMVEALCATIDKIQAQCKLSLTEKSEIPVLWFFPYFMEPRVILTKPNFTMLDYKVNYDNHALFRGDKSGKGHKKGSPVRIFTNVPAKQIRLPEEEGYWYCTECEKSCSAENQHCDLCRTCTTKDGSTYKHCMKCARCVKPSRIHCDNCNICDLPTHSCNTTKTKGCHICGKMGHKRRECPQKSTADAVQPTLGSRKRPADDQTNFKTKAKKGKFNKKKKR